MKRLIKTRLRALILMLCIFCRILFCFGVDKPNFIATRQLN